MWVVIVFVCLLGAYAIYAVIDVLKSDTRNLKLEEKKKYEQTYFEAQRDALSGDVRIKKLDNRTWVWVKPPYNDTTKPFSDTIYVISVYK